MNFWIFWSVRCFPRGMTNMICNPAATGHVRMPSLAYKRKRATVPGTVALGGVATSISDKARGPTEEA